MAPDPKEPLLETLKKTAGALKRADIRFALAGSLAAYARGGVFSRHDIDFIVLKSDAPAVETALSCVGLRVVHPPEDWLIKAYDEDRLVDILFRLGGVEISTQLLDRAEELQVESVLMPVMAATDLITALLLSLTEPHCDFGPALRVSRPLREQIDWDRVTADTSASPYARAFVLLLQELNVLDTPEEPLLLDFPRQEMA
jgi:hypothetical protein